VGIVCNVIGWIVDPTFHVIFDYSCSTPAPYPATLAGLLSAAVDNSGRQGESTSAGRDRLSTGLPVPPPALGPNHDVVIIMQGTNDANSFDAQRDPPDEVAAKLDTIETNLRMMVGYARSLGKEVVLNTLPPTVPVQVTILGVGDVYKGPEPPAIQRVNDRIRIIWDSYSGDAGFVGADVYAAFMQSNPAGLLSQDGLHPNEAGYNLIALTVRDAISRF
jgi:lysophospholipase L1-like esterase